jgi:purine nucleosidase
VFNRRLIINTDAKNEADDQFAIVHALLSPSLDIRGIVPAHFGSSRTPTSRADSREEVDLLLGYLGMAEGVVVADGADAALADEFTASPSAGSRLIIDEAMSSDERLFVAFLGPLTDMASAILEEPAIQDRDVVVVWIGGPPYGGTVPEYSHEFNLTNDIAAANVVFDSRLTIWQIPMSVYTMVGVGYAELEGRVRPCGPLGEYLTQQLIDVNTFHGLNMEYRSLGDSPAIGVVMNPSGAIWRDWPRPRFTADSRMIESDGASILDGPLSVTRTVETDRSNRTVRVAESIDSRWLLEDMFHKIEQFAKSDSVG